jgi:hypothetical protein
MQSHSSNLASIILALFPLFLNLRPALITNRFAEAAVRGAAAVAAIKEAITLTEPGEHYR